MSCFAITEINQLAEDQKNKISCFPKLDWATHRTRVNPSPSPNPAFRVAVHTIKEEFNMFG